MSQKVDPKITYAAQIRAARALLGWSQGMLAEKSGVSKQTVNRVESGTTDTRFSTVLALINTLKAAGVEMGEQPDGRVYVMAEPASLSEG